MTKKMTKNKIKILSYKAVIAVIGVLAIGGGAFALTNYAPAPKVNVNGDWNGNITEAVNPTDPTETQVVGDDGELFGAAAGTDHYNAETFWAGFGGNVYATSSVGTNYTIKEGDLEKYSIFEINPTVNSTVFTLPATSTLSTLLKNAGDTKTWIFRNATTSAGITFTLAKGTGWNLTGVDANVDVIAGAASGSQVSMIAQCYRGSKNSTILDSFDITCELREDIAAD